MHEALQEKIATATKPIAFAKKYLDTSAKVKNFRNNKLCKEKLRLLVVKSERQLDKIFFCSKKFCSLFKLFWSKGFIFS